MATRKKGTPAAGGNGTHTQDIDHELVTSDGTPPIPAKIISIDDQIKQEIAKFNLAEAGIAQLKEQYGDLVISDFNDKTGYKLVKDAWNFVRSKRTGLEKKGLEIRNGYGVITKAVKKEEDRLINLLEPLEEDLYQKWKAVDAEKERIQKEKEAAEEAALIARIEDLQNLGMTFQDGFYVIGETISVDVATLRIMPEEQYGKFKAAVTTKATEIREAEEKAAEKKRQEEEEFARQQREFEAQREEMRQQKAEMDRQREEMEKQRQQIAVQKLQHRIDRFKSLGMAFRLNIFVFDNDFRSIRLDLEKVQNEPEETFEELISKTAAQITEANEAKAQHEESVKKEKEALEAKKKMISKYLESAGMRFDYGNNIFRFESSMGSMSITFEILMHETEEYIADKSLEIANQIIEWKRAAAEKENADKMAMEQELLNAKDDKEKFALFISQLRDLSKKILATQFKTKKWGGFAATVKAGIDTLLKPFE